VADVYSLSVRADTSDIRRGRNDLDRFGNQAGSTRSTVTELGKSLVIFTAAATATSVALGAMAVKSIKAAKEVVGLARVANSTVPEFQKMAFGAKSVGIETGQLSDILKDMSDRVGDFLTTGGGEMADFFEKIAPQVGVTAEQFRGLSGPDALQLYVSTLEKANLSQSEMTFYMEAIANDSTRLLPLLRNNGAAMAEQAKQADALGIALSEVDAQNITDAAEQIDRVGSVFSALSEQIAAEVSPLVSALSRQFLDFTEDAGGVDEAVSDLTENVDILKASFAGLAGAAATLTAIAVATRAATAAQIAFNIAARANPYVFLATALGTAAAAIYSLNDSMDPAIERAQLLKIAIGDLTDNLDLLTRSELENRKSKFSQDMIDSRTEAEKLGAQLETVQDIIRNSGQLTPQGGAMQIATSEDINRARALKTQIDELNLSADASAGAIEDVNALIESLGKKSETSSTELEKAAKAADNYASVISALNPAQAEFTRYADQLDMIDTFNISAGEKEALREESFRQHQERMIAIASEGNAGMIATASDGQRQKLLEDEQENTLRSSASFFGNLAAIAQKGGKDQFEAYKVLASAQAAISATMAIVSTLGDPTVPSFLRVPLAFSIGALAAAQVAQIQSQTYSGARAMGGSVTGGNSYMVGENGPEVVTMGGSGVVTPSSVNGGESKSDVFVTINNAPAGTRTEERTDERGNRFVDVFLADMSNGGPMSKTIQGTFGVRRQGR